jgi:hypothetical protein
MIVLCINDNRLPPGANIQEGKEYEVMDQYKNMLDQVVYVIKGVNNQGRTKLGMEWRGYRAERFVPIRLKKYLNKKVSFYTIKTLYLHKIKSNEQIFFTWKGSRST